MIINILIFLIGLILLVKGSDHFVKSASLIAKKLGISEFIIGLTLVAIGTSIPEFISAITASIKKSSGLILGNIIGANIANLTLIIGIAALISRIKIKNGILKREGYLMVFSAILFLFFLFNDSISRIEGAVFLIIFIFYIILLFKKKQKFKEYHFKEFIRHIHRFQYASIKDKLISGGKNTGKLISYEKKKIEKLFNIIFLKYFLIMIFSGFFMIVGANYVVEEAIFFADLFNISFVFIGIIMSIGTTIPELSVALAASRKGYGNIILGNAIGSCIANTLLILGTASLIYPITGLLNVILPILLFMIFAMILFLFLARTKFEISRIEGLVFLIVYILFIVLSFSGVL
ncbi:MAG TPA: calcium/sodium antiporter [Candidatus Nanoarchaeia archaeon]|nr:calcium/sodium antiporter [Candidatus Nanoarchaeia archaeon]